MIFCCEKWSEFVRAAKWIANATIITRSNKNNNNNANRQILECQPWRIFFIYENNKRNKRGYALTGPQNPKIWTQIWIAGPGWVSWHAYNLHVDIGAIFMNGEAAAMAAYVIWKIFMKQYARLRYGTQGPPGPTLIWHSYAAIQSETETEDVEVGYRLYIVWGGLSSIFSGVKTSQGLAAVTEPFIDLNWVIFLSFCFLSLGFGHWPVASCHRGLIQSNCRLMWLALSELSRREFIFFRRFLRLFRGRESWFVIKWRRVR